MHRARKRSVGAIAAGALACSAIVLAAPRAWAFHNGNNFDKAPGAGGGGGIFYAGTPREHAWDCTMCHEKPAGKISLQVNASPQFTGGRYTPDQIYQFDIAMTGEHLGHENPLYNFNSLVVEFVDENGFLVGNITGIAPDPEGHTDFYGGGGQTQIASTGIKTGVTSWSFKWQAGNPDFGPAKGPVSVFFAVVDGDGGYINDPKSSDPDPFNDDVYLAKVKFEEGPAMMGARTPNGGAPLTLVPIPPMDANDRSPRLGFGVGVGVDTPHARPASVPHVDNRAARRAASPVQTPSIDNSAPSHTGMLGAAVCALGLAIGARSRRRR